MIEASVFFNEAVAPLSSLKMCCSFNEVSGALDQTEVEIPDMRYLALDETSVLREAVTLFIG